MTKTMLIDAANEEEVRVCVLHNNKVEDFDFESATRKPLRGNIYLARVTRVEPSLQAAFVEFGGNRHGFLAFNEIHPDYYQIPISDRRAIQEADAEEAALAAALNIGHGDGEDDDDDDDGGIEEIDQHESRPDGGRRRKPKTREFDAPGDQPDSDQPDSDPNVAADDADDVETTAQGDTDPASEPAPDDDAAIATDENVNDDDDNEEEEEDSREDPDDLDSDEGEEGDSQEEEPSLEAEYDGDDEASADAEDADDEDEDEDEDGDDELAPKREDPFAGVPRAELIERYKEARRKRARLLRNYKIQEVIKRRQILLVQAVKEERGNKGAALTTYLSLAGRYCVLMPNTARGGGISRKIPVAADRKRLRRIVDGLDVPTGMGLIIRTAGAKRTKAEIKRDYEYLVRLWENIRTLTLKSIAPCLIYEEASLIKRAIRDLYDKDIGQILVEGDGGYREAKDFMKMLMPSHSKNVQPYKDATPLFLRYGVESQLDAMYQPIVRLKSGGYIVINQTEALIAIDVNSGKATRERNIEQTALRTNLEAADEAARQCRLRDLAGLIVIDFIDMEEGRNDRAVEKRLKDALRADRARIQVGRISSFGLLEMSRQRRRSGIVDGTTHACPTCGGAGAVRSHEMAALRILRAAEHEAISGKAGNLQIKAALDVTLYILNHKRAWLARIEQTYGVVVELIADVAKAGDNFEIEKTGAKREVVQPQVEIVRADTTVTIESDPEEESVEAPDESEDDDARETATSGAQLPDKEGKRRRRRRRRRRAPGETSSEDAQPFASASEEPSDDAGDAGDDAPAEVRSEDGSEQERDEQRSRRRRRRGRRGGRRNGHRSEGGEAHAANGGERPAHRDAETDQGARETSFSAPSESDAPSEASRAAPVEVIRGFAPSVSTPDPAPEPSLSSGRAKSEEPAAVHAAEAPKSGKKGWWQRAFGE